MRNKQTERTPNGSEVCMFRVHTSRRRVEIITTMKEQYNNKQWTKLDFKKAMQNELSQKQKNHIKQNKNEKSQK
jgi:hypothetical protein